MEKLGDTNSMFDPVEERENDEEKKKQKIEKIINTVLYSLSIALIN